MFRHWSQQQYHLLHVVSVVMLVIKDTLSAQRGPTMILTSAQGTPLRGGTNQVAIGSAWTGKASVLIHMAPFYMK